MLIRIRFSDNAGGMLSGERKWLIVASDYGLRDVYLNIRNEALRVILRASFYTTRKMHNAYT